MSQLIEFYRGIGTDAAGRSLSQLWDYDDDAMEYHHDFIQWLFPLQEPSQFNRHSPRLSESDIAEFRADPDLRDRLLCSLDRFLLFLGLRRTTNEIAPRPDFPTRSDLWMIPNHNWLRITRVLHCLRLLGMDDQARTLLDCLEKLQAEGKAQITLETLRYWREALNPQP